MSYRRLNVKPHTKGIYRYKSFAVDLDVKMGAHTQQDYVNLVTLPAHERKIVEKYLKGPRFYKWLHSLTETGSAWDLSLNFAIHDKKPKEIQVIYDHDGKFWSVHTKYVFGICSDYIKASDLTTSFMENFPLHENGGGHPDLIPKGDYDFSIHSLDNSLSITVTKLEQSFQTKLFCK